MNRRHNLTGIQKLEANDERERRFLVTLRCCVRCRKHPESRGDVLQLAHRIRKGLVSKYGAAVVHHFLSAVPSCSKCNQLLLVHGEEERALAARIERILSGDEEADIHEEYRLLHVER